MLIWLEFLAAAALIILAAVQLTKYGDALALRTGLGAMFVGTLLMAGATSLPELLSSISAILQGAPNLAAGNMLGSCMVNMLLLGAISLTFWRMRMLRRVAVSHSMSAALGILLMAMAIFFILAKVEVRIGWMGLDSLVLIVAYIVGIWLLRQQAAPLEPPSPIDLDAERVPTLRRAIIGFLLASAVLVVVSPWMIQSSVRIAEITGLGTGFVGTALVAMVTSLPELVTTLAAARLGAYDLAVGELFGSNLFNLFALGLSDLFYVQGRFLGAVDPSFALVGLLAIILTGLGLVGNLTRTRERRFHLDVEALLIVIIYVLGLWLLYERGVGA
jgi:cation:H+ antiporter